MYQPSNQKSEQVSYIASSLATRTPHPSLLPLSHSLPLPVSVPLTLQHRLQQRRHLTQLSPSRHRYTEQHRTSNRVPFQDACTSFLPRSQGKGKKAPSDSDTRLLHALLCELGSWSNLFSYIRAASSTTERVVFRLSVCRIRDTTTTHRGKRHQAHSYDLFSFLFSLPT